MQKWGRKDDGCAFCEIVSGARHASVVYQNDHVLAFLDHFKQPATGAHVLIITRGHFPAVWHVSDDIGSPFLHAVRAVATALKGQAHGVKLGCWASNGSAAGQAIEHFHLHLLTLDRPFDLVRYYIRVELLRRRPTAARLAELGAILQEQIRRGQQDSNDTR